VRIIAVFIQSLLVILAKCYACCSKACYLFNLLKAYRDDFPRKREYTPDVVGKSARLPMRVERYVTGKKKASAHISRLLREELPLSPGNRSDMMDTWKTKVIRERISLLA
jgi:hypothetical protein